MKELFQLDPAVAFLNHGSFGACPREIYDAFQDYQREMERQPVAFLQREYPERMQGARDALAKFLGADKDDLVFVPNATFGLNVAAASLELGPGDEVLTNNHEYGATHRMWEAICRRRGAALRTNHLPHRAESADQLFEEIVRPITDQTRVLFLSHITSTTAITMPVTKVIAECRARGVICMVDGAHGPGQIDLDLHRLDPDIYAGNCHKWLMAPKSAGFLYVRKELHDRIEPLSVSWGEHSHSATSFVREMEYSGTFNVAAYLAVGDCVRFLERHNWAAVRKQCTALRADVEERVRAITGLPSLYGEPAVACAQMVTMELPEDIDVIELKRRLYDEFLVEAPVLELEGRKYIRASLQGYNGADDVVRLEKGLASLLAHPIS